MNDLSTNIGSQIGALELSGDLESHVDGVLEAAARANAGATQQIACTMGGRCIGDAALESAGTNLNQPPTRMVILTRCQ